MLIARPDPRGDDVTRGDELIPGKLRPFAYVILSAALFGISAPVSKLLVSGIGPVALAGLLYLGAFLGLGLFRLSRPGKSEESELKREDVPYLAGAIVCGGVIAPILLMSGIASVTGIASSLLLNLEGVATALIAWLAFKEIVGRRTWSALVLMTLAGVLLALDAGSGESTVLGAALIVMAMFFWGLDNNLTMRIAGTGPQRIAMLKGLVAGTASLSLAFLLGQEPSPGLDMLAALVLGSLSYGASLVLFIMALDFLGSARTGAFFALGPFIGALVSVPLLGEVPELTMLPAGILMAMGAYLLLTERPTNLHWHPRVVHTHVHDHTGEHGHPHPSAVAGTHSHEHVHEAVLHEHEHDPNGRHQH